MIRRDDPRLAGPGARAAGRRAPVLDAAELLHAGAVLCTLGATALLVAGASGLNAAPPSRPSPPGPPAQLFSATGSGPGAQVAAAAVHAVTTGRPAGAAGALPRSRPAWLTVASIGVSTPLMDLGVQPDGTPDVPPLEPHAPAGWITSLPSPGEPGAAVLLGHLDSARDGPAVFFRLGQLHRGDPILVDRQDGRRAQFTVTSVLMVPKAQFPAGAVYGPAGGPPVLRLVTCGGPFDRQQGSYQDNVIVFASLTGVSAR